jgi:hypothetical protein
MKSRALWDLKRAWRRVPERWQHRVYAFLAGGMLAAIGWRLAGW